MVNPIKYNLLIIGDDFNYMTLFSEHVKEELKDQLYIINHAFGNTSYIDELSEINYDVIFILFTESIIEKIKITSIINYFYSQTKIIGILDDANWSKKEEVLKAGAIVCLKKEEYKDQLKKIIELN